MIKIKVRTQFDITATGVTGHYKSSRDKFDSIDQWNRARNQQRNWETLTQLISLRTQVNISMPAKQADSWTFDFEFEIDSIFHDGTDPIGTLKNDCQGVPMLLGLDETQKLASTLDPEENIWFEIIE